MVRHIGCHEGVRAPLYGRLEITRSAAAADGDASNLRAQVSSETEPGYTQGSGEMGEELRQRHLPRQLSDRTRAVRGARIRKVVHIVRDFVVGMASLHRPEHRIQLP